MALIPETKYPGKITPASANYPYGEAQNITVPGDGTGTPWEEALVNDVFGMQQALLKAATVVPNGNPDRVGASQYLQALVTLLSSRGMTYTETGIANAYVLTALTDNQLPAALLPGLKVKFTAGNTNTGASTLSFISVQNIIDQQTGAALKARDIVAGKSYECVWNGVAWELIKFALFHSDVFTPTIYGSSTAGAATGTFVGNYIRIADWIAFYLSIALTSKGGMVGAIKIGNLPAVVSGQYANVLPAFNFGRAYQMNFVNPNNLHLAAYGDNSNSTMSLIYYDITAGSGNNAIQDANLIDTSLISVSGFYRAQL